MFNVAVRARDQSSIFSAGGKFRPDYGLLLELHALTLVARSYALLLPHTHVAVPDRNQMLFHHEFQAHHQDQSTVLFNIHQGWSSYALHTVDASDIHLNAVKYKTLSRLPHVQILRFHDTLLQMQ